MVASYDPLSSYGATTPKYKPRRRKVAPDPWQRTFSLGGRRVPRGGSKTTTPRPGRGRGGQPIGETADGMVIYQDPDTGQIWAEAKQRAESEVNPILAELGRRQSEEEARAKAFAEASNLNYDKAIATQRPLLQQAYAKGVEQSTAIENAVKSSLAGAGSEAGAELAAKLAQINTPGQQASVDALNTTYSGAGNANYAMGMDDVQTLVARGAEVQAWLEKQPLAFREQTAAALAEALGEIGADYRDQIGGIQADLPTRIREIFESEYGRQTDESRYEYERKLGERDRKTEQSRYEDEQNAAQIAAAQERLAELEERRMKLQLAIMSSNDKRQIARWREESKALDRQSREETARLNRLAQNQRTAATLSKPGDAATSDKYILDAEGNIIGENPNYVPPRGDKPKNRAAKAWKGISSYIGQFKSSEGDQVMVAREELPETDPRYKAGSKQKVWVQEPSSDPLANTTNAQLVASINGELQAAGIPPNSPEGIRLRSRALRSLGLKVGPKGNPYAPSKKRARRGGR